MLSGPLVRLLIPFGAKYDLYSKANYSNKAYWYQGSHFLEGNVLRKIIDFKNRLLRQIQTKCSIWK